MADCLCEDCCRESCSLFRVLRCRAPSSPIDLSEVPFALSCVFLLSSGGKSVLLMKKKAPSCSGILLPMHVVLKTRHVNPNIHVRRFIVHVRSPNLSATRPQLFIPMRSNNLIEVTSQSYIALPMHPYTDIWDHCASPPLHYLYLLLEKRRSHLMHPRMERCQVGSCLE